MGKQEEKKEQELKLSFYSVSMLLAVLIAAFNTVITFVNTAKPEYYFLTSRIGGGFDEDKDLYLDLYSALFFSDDAADNMMKKAYIVAGFAAVTTVLLIIAVSRVANTGKKPAFILTLIAFFMSIGVLLAFFFMRDYAMDCFKEKLERYDVVEKHEFTIYDYCLIGCIANAVCCLFAVFGANFATIKYKKDNK